MKFPRGPLPGLRTYNWKFTLRGWHLWRSSGFWNFGSKETGGSRYIEALFDESTAICHASTAGAASVSSSLQTDGYRWRILKPSLVR